MSEPFYPREVVASKLSISTATLLRYESRGLIHAKQGGSGEVVGYGPVEVRRLWMIVTFQRDLGINLAGVEVILRLRDQIDDAQAHLHRLARNLQGLVDLDAEASEMDADFR